LSRDHNPTKITKKESTREYINVKCACCGAYGHKKISCDKMCQWLLLKTAAATLDESTQKKMLDNYAKVTKEHHECQRQQTQGRIRQLYHEGHLAEADTLWAHLDEYNYDSDSIRSDSS
jgi:hypothetical protein